MDSQPYPFSSNSVQGTGKISVSNVAAKIVLATQVKTVVISSLPENTARIYVGPSGLLSDGTKAAFYLDPGDDVSLNHDLSSQDLYVVAELAWLLGALLRFNNLP